MRLYRQTKIAFNSDRDGNSEIYIMNADGSEQKNLTNNHADDSWHSWSFSEKKIAFTSKRDGNQEIYIMNADGSEQKNLTNNPAWDYYPFWSPDGKKIAFVSYRDGNQEIYVMNADGSEQKNLTNNPAYDSATSWSPDGKKIAFVSQRDGNYEIYVMNADGSQQKRLTNNPASDSFPIWSPFLPLETKENKQEPLEEKLYEQTKIAFGSDRDGNEEIYVMNADGSEQKRLTNSPALDWAPFWSPDGKKIAFHSYTDGNIEIYVMNADGSEQKRLTSNPACDFSPSWSPFLPLETKENKQEPKKEDISPTVSVEQEPAREYTPPKTSVSLEEKLYKQTKIAFDSNRDGNTDIYVMNVDGSEQKNLTNNPANDGFPSWSPDGKKIAFISYRDGNNEIYVMNADGTDQKRLTNNPANDAFPSWSSFLAFETKENKQEPKKEDISPTVSVEQEPAREYTPPKESIVQEAPREDGLPKESVSLEDKLYKQTKIAFESKRDGNTDIYIMNPDGSGQKRLTNNPAFDMSPSWSPDGKKIAFVSLRDGYEIYVMNADGTGVMLQSELDIS